MPSRYPRYELILKLYPKSYRERYGEQMVQTLGDMLDDQPTRPAKTWVWLRACLDLAGNIVQQNLMYVGEVMTNQTPHYVKRNSLIGTALLLPFFIVISSRVLQRNDVSNSTVWQSSLYIMLVFLPLMAFVLAAATFIKWSNDSQESWWKNLLNIRQNWMITAVGTLGLLIALFVPFHDSVHCVTGDPIQEVQHIGQTWDCVWSSK